MNANAQQDYFELPYSKPSEIAKVSLSPRMEVFKILRDDIPKNDYDLPQYLYTPTYISEDFFEQTHQDQVEILNHAMIEITYDEGFPAFADGSTIWSQMESEPAMMYDAFQEYLQQITTFPIRQIAAIETSKLSLHDLQQGYLYYSWSARSKAFDMFNIAAHSKMRERRILSSNEQSFLKAEQLFKGLDVYYQLPGDEDPNNLRWIEELTPAVAIKYMEVLNKIQRISLGLPVGGGENLKKEGPENADTDVLMKTLVAAGRNSLLSGGTESKISIDMLLNDPETAEIAQRLIIQARETPNES